MTTDDRDHMFDIICQMSDSQVDPVVKTTLKEFIGKPNEEVKDPLIDLLDKIVYSALTSDFEIKVLNYIWFEIGGTEEELSKRIAKAKPNLYDMLNKITEENIQESVEYGQSGNEEL